MSAARTEQISVYRERGYEIVQITVPKDHESNRPSAIMLNPITNETVLISHTGEVVPTSGAAAEIWENSNINLGDKI